ncbi:MAG: hypothetical protein RLY93_11740 [Sumerlaeia bacterium]
MIRVSCHLTDCAYWNAPANPEAKGTPPIGSHPCDCAHPEKPDPQYRDARPCPLYKKNWRAASAGNAEDLAARFANRGKKKPR